MKRAYLITAISFLIFIVYGFSLSFVDADQDIFLTFVFSGYFILGVILGVLFRKKFLWSLVTAFPLTFLSWLIAFVLFSSSGGMTTFVQALSEGFPNALIAGLLFSFTTLVAVLFAAIVFKLLLFVSKRFKKTPVDLKD